MLRPALVYWAGIFALGFVLGTIRTFWLVPRIGELGAVACELPLMLAASWLWVGRVLRRYPLPERVAAIGMGAIAFAVLMASEAGLAIALGRSFSQWLGALWEPAGLLGLAGQIIFAAFPGLRWRPSVAA